MGNNAQHQKQYYWIKTQLFPPNMQDTDFPVQKNNKKAKEKNEKQKKTKQKRNSGSCFKLKDNTVFGMLSPTFKQTM